MVLRSSIAFLLGTLLTQLCSSIPDVWVLFVMSFLSIVSLVAGYYCRLTMIQLTGFVGFGFVYLLCHAMWVLSSPLPDPVLGKTLWIEGNIISTPVEHSRRIQFMVLAKRWKIKQQWHTLPKAKIIKLNWYFNSDQKYQLQKNETWQLPVRLKRPWSQQNPGSFDYEKWLFSQKMAYLGYVVDGLQLKLIKPANPGFSLSSLHKKIKLHLPDTESGSLLSSLIIGDRSQLTPTMWKILQKTGTSHLMAISGLHIGLLATIAGFILLHLWRCHHLLPTILPAKTAAFIGAWIIAAIYAVLSGFALPSQRAFIMLSVVVIMHCLRYRLALWQSLAFALWIILLFNPLATLTIGFWLSFSAVAAIAYGVGYRTDPHIVNRLFGAQWSVTLLLAPLILWFFQSVSLISLLANVIAIPVIGFIVLPMSFAGLLLVLWFPDLADMCFNLSAFILDYLWQYLTVLSHFPGAQWHHPITSLFVLITTLIGLLILLIPKGWPYRWLGCFWLLPLLLMPLHAPIQKGKLRFTLLDVGQGLSIVIQTQHHTLLYDTGPYYSDSYNAGESVIIPYLRSQGISNLSMVMVSHSDSDHRGGLQSIVNAIPVKHVITSDPKRLSVNSKPCYQGQYWEWDGIRFEILSPLVTVKQQRKRNNGSCVLKITAPDGRILLTGDIEKSVEKWLLKTYLKKNLSAELLVVPHHGSLSSSTPDFIQAVNPKVALFASGYKNRFGFPKKSVVQRYDANGTKTYVSALCGAMRFELNGEKKQWVPKCYRQQHPHFWQTKASC